MTTFCPECDKLREVLLAQINAFITLGSSNPRLSSGILIENLVKIITAKRTINNDPIDTEKTLSIAPVAVVQTQVTMESKVQCNHSEPVTILSEVSSIQGNNPMEEEAVKDAQNPKESCQQIDLCPTTTTDSMSSEPSGEEKIGEKNYAKVSKLVSKPYRWCNFGLRRRRRKLKFRPSHKIRAPPYRVGSEIGQNSDQVEKFMENSLAQSLSTIKVRNAFKNFSLKKTLTAHVKLRRLDQDHNLTSIMHQYRPQHRSSDSDPAIVTVMNSNSEYQNRSQTGFEKLKNKLIQHGENRSNNQRVKFSVSVNGHTVEIEELTESECQEMEAVVAAAEANQCDNTVTTKRSRSDSAVVMKDLEQILSQTLGESYGDLTWRMI